MYFGGAFINKIGKELKNIKLYIASMMIIFLTFSSWVQFFQLNCWFLISPMIVLLVISHSFIQLKMHERVCFKNCYFKDESLFSKMLTSKITVIIFYVIISVFMTFSVLYAIIEYSWGLWVYLFVHTAFVLMVYRFLDHLFKNTVHSKFRPIFAREWTINIGAVPFILVYIYFITDGYEPSYLRSSLEETYQVASNSIYSACHIISDSLRLQREIDSISWWTVVNGTSVSKHQILNMSTWILFIATNSLVVLGMNRFIVQIIYLIDRLFKKINRGENEGRD